MLKCKYCLKPFNLNWGLSTTSLSFNLFRYWQTNRRLNDERRFGVESQKLKITVCFQGPSRWIDMVLLFSQQAFVPPDFVAPGLIFRNYKRMSENLTGSRYWVHSIKVILKIELNSTDWSALTKMTINGFINKKLLPTRYGQAGKFSSTRPGQPPEEVPECPLQLILAQDSCNNILVKISTCESSAERWNLIIFISSKSDQRPPNDMIFLV